MEKSTIIIIIIAIALLTMGILLGIYYYLKHRKPTPPNPPNPPGPAIPNPPNPPGPAIPNPPGPSGPPIPNPPGPPIPPSPPKPPIPAPPTPGPGPGPSPGPANPKQIYYGDSVKLLNHTNNLPLAICNTSPGCGSFNATLAKNSAYVIGITWRITGIKSNGNPVLYGDIIQIVNPMTNKSVAACGETGNECGVNVIVGKTNPDNISDKWQIIGGEIGKGVLTDDSIHLVSQYNTQKLSACGYYQAGGICGINVSLSTDTDIINKIWTIVCQDNKCHQF